MSRGSWLAFGSLAIAGCSGAVVLPPADTGDASAGSTQAQRDAASTPASDGAAHPVDASKCSLDRNATFECGTGVTCDRATQYCSLTAGTKEPQGCAQDDSYPFPSACRACPTFDCIQTQDTGNCVVMEIDDGRGIGLACGGCYGSPPARLERTTRAA